MKAKPTLGYASRTDAVIAMRAAGLTTATIASKIGIAVGTVKALECSATRSVKRTPLSNERRRSLGTIELTNGQRQGLRFPAAKRNLSIGALLSLVIDRIVDDGLVDAILDDHGVAYK